MKLLGVEIDSNKAKQAINYIQEKTKGRKVYMRFDERKYDTNNNLLCYLYLENKTFINAHLIKEKLAIANNTTEYKYKTKFNSY